MVAAPQIDGSAKLKQLHDEFSCRALSHQNGGDCKLVTPFERTIADIKAWPGPAGC